jgi:hypothetical protein
MKNVKGKKLSTGQKTETGQQTALRPEAVVIMEQLSRRVTI